MTLAGAASLVMTLAAAASLAAMVFYMRPLLARSKAGVRAVELRYRIRDGIDCGVLDPNDEAVRLSLYFTDDVAKHPEHYGLTEALAVHRTFVKLGIDDPAQVVPLPTYANVCPEGRRLLIDVDKEMKHILADYYVHGSKLWWVIAPTRAVARRRKSPMGPEFPTPGALAADVVRASRSSEMGPILRTTTPSVVT